MNKTTLIPHLKLAGALFLATLAILFTVQNVESAEIRFLVWKKQLSLSLLIFGVLAAGITVGWLVSSWIYISRAREKKAAAQKP